MLVMLVQLVFGDAVDNAAAIWAQAKKIEAEAA